MQVAQTILEQLGGNRFIAMTGARNLVAGDNMLMFKIPGGGGFARKGINCVQVTLRESDLYTVKFFKVTKAGAATVAHLEGVYADNLQAVFTEHTGLYTKL